MRQRYDGSPTGALDQKYRYSKHVQKLINASSKLDMKSPKTF